MSSKYMKDKRSGLVIDTTADYSKYLQEKQSMKALAKTKKELDNTKGELTSIKVELTEVKELLKQLLNKGI